MPIKKEVILRQAIATYGTVLQKVVATEELSELTKEISKSIRGANNRKDMLEEIADVHICLDQLMMMYEISDEELEEEINFKLIRLNGRLRGE